MFEVIITAAQSDNTDIFKLSAYANCLSELQIEYCEYKQGNISCLRISCERKRKTLTVKVIKELISDSLLRLAKKEYIKDGLCKCGYNFDGNGRLLLDALVTFDRERDYIDLSRNLSIYKVVSLDGYFAFRMQQIKMRWDKLIAITKENLRMINADKCAFSLFIKFILSTAMPKSNFVRIVSVGNSYLLKPDGFPPMRICGGFNALLLSLIEIAPMQIDSSRVTDHDEKKQLQSVFYEKQMKNFV